MHQTQDRTRIIATRLASALALAALLAAVAPACAQVDTKARIDIANQGTPPTSLRQQRTGADAPLTAGNRTATGGAQGTQQPRNPALDNPQARGLNYRTPVQDSATPDLINSTQDQINRQAQGNYGSLDRSISLPQGAVQNAWDRPTPTQGQVSPGVIRFTWSPDLIMQIRTRDLMATEIILPEWEAAAEVYVGDPSSMETSDVRKNILAVRPMVAGVDTTISIIGTSGNLYKFYVRSDGVQSQQLPDLTVYVTAGHPGRTFGPGVAASPGPSSSGHPAASAPAIPRNGFVRNASAATGGFTGSPAAPVTPASTAAQDYLRNFNVRPEQVTFPYRMLERSPGDREIAPDRVFTDGIWTYLDYGARGDTVRRPVVYAVVDGVNSMVNTRTIGDRQQILVIEHTGTDFTLRNGQKVVCLKIERPDSPRTRNIQPVLSPAPRRVDSTMYDSFFGVGAQSASAPGEIHPRLNNANSQ